MSTPILTTYSDGVYAIDSGYIGERMDAIHLIVDAGRVALVDTANFEAVPRVLSELRTLGLSADQVDYVVLTHVHLDHAGAAGHFMQEFGQARLVVHPRGARHMIAPDKLQAAVSEVYGAEAAQRMYGKLLPVPPERIIEAVHGLKLKLGERELSFYDAPGHCRHHILIHDGRSGHVFAGDTMGLSYRQLDGAGGQQFIFPSTSPSQFDPQAFHQTLDQIERLRPGAAYLTHYAQVTDVSRLLGDMRRLIDAFVDVARSCQSKQSRHQQIKTALSQLFVQEAAAQGWALQGQAVLDFLEMDIELNAQGLGVWLDA